jgi:hypothetical protein
MISRTNKQVLRRALKEKKGGIEVELSLFFFSSREASKHVILSAEGAKDMANA